MGRCNAKIGFTLIELMVTLAIIGVLALYVFQPPTFIETPYESAPIDTRIPKDLIERPEYRRLRLPVELPIVPGRMGRDNPFEPY